MANPTDVPAKATPSSSEALAALAATLLEKPATRKPKPRLPTMPETLSDQLAKLSVTQMDAQFHEFKEDQVIRDLLANGLDLKEQAQRFQGELRVAEVTHLDQYYQQRGRIQDLHHQIASCDDILDHMEQLLTGFQGKLGNINQSIQELQDASAAMTVKLQNRMQVATQLDKVVDGLVVPPDLVQAVCHADIDPAYVDHVQTLGLKLRYVRHQAHRSHPMAAVRDVQPELERLLLVSAARIRHFLLDKIKAVRTLTTNIQIIQRTVLTRYQGLNHFLIERHPETACEIRDNYIYTTRFYYAEHFDRYSRGLQRLLNVMADRSDLLGLDETTKFGGLFGTARPALKDRKYIFSLGDRLAIVTHPAPQVIIPHVAEDKKDKVPLEVLFRSYNLALIDNTTSEYEFVSQFFITPGTHHQHKGSDTAKAIFEHIFEPVCNTGLGLTRLLTEHSFDALGVLLCLRINYQLANELQHRRVPVLEKYINATNMQLWPRFQAIVALHTDSMKKLFTGSSKAAALSKQDVHPHFVTRRYAEFVASLLALNQDPPTNVVDQSLARLRTELEAMLLRISEGFGNRVTTLIFLINNYDLVVTILHENGFPSGSAAESDYFAQCKATCIAEYVEEQLDSYFGYLKSFVSATELATNNATPVAPAVFAPVVAEFNTTFKDSLANINAAVIRSFSNFKNGTTILHSVLGQLILYYSRFHQLYDRHVAKKTKGGGGSTAMAGQRTPVGVQNVMVEIKKYKSNF
ncbi:Vacuolar protein sorting-associated protein 52 [Dimargaris verticillata]|uniref:Vacuolar protein sorting-associated protein 52 n=1 Tax=Dimargaris verticillata TaxID=2761393 RepID=A0A9W8B483_9FUNG|nr:Vacuolar protein sorting-associated protein 52 [Dimargaris verticillata]